MLVSLARCCREPTATLLLAADNVAARARPARGTKAVLRGVVAIWLAFFVMGFVDAAGVLVGYAREQFGLTGVAAGLLPLAGFAAFALVSVPAGVLASRRGKRATLALGLALVLAGELVPAASVARYAYLVAAVCLVGVGMALVQVAGNPLVLAVARPGRDARDLAFAQFIKSIGSNTAPLVVPALVAVGWRWTAVFPCFAAVTALALALAATLRVRERASASASLMSCVALLRDRRVVSWVFVIFMYVGAEVGIAAWTASYLHASFDLPLGTATGCIALFLGGLALGRLAGSALLAALPPRQMLAACTIAGVLATAALLVPVLPIALVGLAFAGLAYANVWPLVFSIAVEERPARAPELSGLLCTAILGGAVVPLAMGWLADTWSLRAALVLPLAAFVQLARVARRA
jgi:fucose permease